MNAAQEGSAERASLRGAVAVVTGASSGIGQAIARKLGESGGKVVVVARRYEPLASLAREIGELGGQGQAVVADLRDERQLVRAFEVARDAYGGLDILVNAAGLGRIAPLIEPSSEALREMWEVNVHALCIATREALRLMRPSNKGHIVHISSMSGYRVQCGSGFYAATKHAVRALTEGLRRELRAEGSAIRVSSISPGDTESGFLEAMYGVQGAAAVTASPYEPMRRQDVAQAVLYALTAPPNVEVHDILMRPVGQPD